MNTSQKRGEAESREKSSGLSTFKKFTILAVVGLLSTMSVMTAASESKVAYINDGGNTYTVTTSHTDTSTIIEDAGIELDYYDKAVVTEQSRERIDIDIIRAFPVKVSVDGSARFLNVTSGTVADALELIDKEVFAYDIVEPPLDTVLEKDMVIEITRGIKKYRLQYKIGGNADYKNENLKEIIPKFDTIFLYDVPSMERTQIVEFCYQNMKRVYINPSMADVVEMHSRHIMLDDMSLFEMSLLGLNAEQNFFKRIFDFILALLALIITFLIVIIAALAIKIEDRGPIFFKQNRATRGGRIFSVYKLRTMKENVNNYLSVVDDERITKVGKILRRFRIDEIPQFINVIKGDMSIVGPRPEMLANIFNYTNDLPEFEYRLRVKAGITGYAQIAGKYNTSPRDKLVLDIMYIEEYSLWLDIKLIFQTLVVLFKKDSTEGFERDTEEKFNTYRDKLDVREGRH